MLSIINQEGFFNLYKAYFATVLSFGTYFGINLMIYEHFKDQIKRERLRQREKQPITDERLVRVELRLWENLLLSFSSGVVASVATNPLDVPKLRMQIQRAEMGQNRIKDLKEGLYGYRNVFHGIYLIVRREGILSLWRGVGARILHMSIQSTVHLTLMEQLRQRILSLVDAR